MPLKTTAIDMHALLDAWEAEREALRARPRPTTHVVDFSCGVEQPVDGGLGGLGSPLPSLAPPAASSATPRCRPERRSVAFELPTSPEHPVASSRGENEVLEEF